MENLNPPLRSLQRKLLQFITHFSDLNVALVSVPTKQEERQLFNANRRFILLCVHRTEEHCFDQWMALRTKPHSCPELTEIELYSMAHELGHYLSLRNHFHNADLNQSNSLFHQGLGDEASRHEVIKEEERAWMYAEWVLLSIGLKDFRVFNEDKESALNTYRHKKMAA